MYPVVVVAAALLTCEPEIPEGVPPPDPAPRRVVAIGAELGRLLVELGVAPRVVGVDTPSLAVAELAHARDLGAPHALSVPLARSLEPELVLVLAAPGSPASDFARALEAAGMRVERLAPRDANEAIGAVHRIGRSVGSEAGAARRALRLAREVSQIATLRDGRRRLEAAWVLGSDPPLVVGGSGLLHELLELAGAENAFHTPADAQREIAWSELADRAPDVVLHAGSERPPVPGARIVAVDAALATLPVLDVASRVRALHSALYGEHAAPDAHGGSPALPERTPRPQ